MDEQLCTSHGSIVCNTWLQDEEDDKSPNGDNCNHRIKACLHAGLCSCISLLSKSSQTDDIPGKNLLSVIFFDATLIYM